MNTHAPIHIFRPGQHTDASGKTLAFSELDLEASAKAYDPALFEAPLVVGHPQLDAPAYGWVASLSFSQSGLSASPRQVDPSFAELVRAGRYKKISASFYLPNSPANPAPAVFYLRHVGFLGAAAPAVKGLKPVAFPRARKAWWNFQPRTRATPGPNARTLACGASCASGSWPSSARRRRTGLGLPTRWRQWRNMDAEGGTRKGSPRLGKKARLQLPGVTKAGSTEVDY